MKTTLKFSIRTDEKWLTNIIRNLNLVECTLGIFIGKIPTKKLNFESLNINIDVREYMYKIEINGNLNSWYSKDPLLDFTRPKFINCIDLLSQTLSIKKSILMNAKVESLIFGSIISFEKNEIDFNEINLLSTFTNQNYKHDFVLDKINNQNNIKLYLYEICDFKKGVLSKYDIKNVKNVILTWNMIVNSWENKTKLILSECLKNESITNNFCNLIIKKSEWKGRKLNDKMRYEDEVKCYFIGLPSINEILHYIECEDTDTIELCESEYSETLELCTHPRNIKRLENILGKIQQYYTENNILVNAY